MTTELLMVAGGTRQARDADVDACVRRALAAVQHSVPRRVTVVADLQLGEAHVACSDSDLQRIVVNLVLNASDAIASAGTIGVRTSRLSKRGIGLSVSDTGCGMSTATLERVSELGFSTKDSSGLGLASVASLVAKAGGIMDIESEIGVGTTVSVLLPGGVHSSGFSNAPSALDGLDTRSLLLVEDDIGSRRALCDLLTDEGFSVTAVGDVASARSFFASANTSLGAVITDMRLPDGTGHDVVRMAQQHQGAVRVICLSGAGYDPSPGPCQSSGTALAFLSKPIDVDALLSILNAKRGGTTAFRRGDTL
jgi:CheY-like chemotaxis protein